MRLFFGIFLNLCLFSAGAQVQIERQVISPLGTSGTGSIILSSTVGQIEYTTGSSDDLTLTQGFQQPAVDAITPLIELTNPECIGEDLAIITIDVDQCPETSISVNGVETDGPTLELDQGVYEILVDGDGCFALDTMTIDFTGIVPCDLVFYTGFSPNGDDNNETWIIENVDQLSTGVNEVEIFTRWGDQVWTGTNYDNVDVVFTGQSSAGQKLPAGTYFFVFSADGFEHNGYIELIR